MKRVLIVVHIIGMCVSLSMGATDPISERTENFQEFPGYFSFYWDSQAGKIWMKIDKLDQEFLYVHSLRTGLGSNDVGLDRNQLGRTRIVKFHRIGPKILLIQSNYAFRALSDNSDERLAVKDAFAESILWGFRFEAEEKGAILVDATDFFLRDAHDVMGTLQRRHQGHFKQDLTRSAINLANTKNFPLNTEVETILSFTSDDPGEFVRQVVPDAHTISLRQHHSFIQLPDDDYRPRVNDPRSNYFGMEYMDFATPINEPVVKRVITRHRLAKKNPKAKVCDPVKPIIYYVDRGVPEPVRSALVEGASWWNDAFEAIGYRKAFIVKVLPEGADPLDIRYNMINWIHRSTRGWSYGDTVTDPRSGEIIKGHVALGSQRLRQDFLIAQGLVGNYEEGKNNSAQMSEMALARIRQLACHEVGHTLGMEHNYASSVNGRASVMDYPHPLVTISEDGSIDLSEAYDEGVGEWDKVSIAFGYQHFPDDVDEEKELKAILDRAFSRGLYYLASQDAGLSSAHPLANTWDNGRHPVDELEKLMKVRGAALDSFSEKRIPLGTPMATLEDVLVPVYFFHRYQIEAAASVVGGLYYNHTLRGDVQADPKIVDGAEQRRALAALLKTIEPANLAISEKILNLIPPRSPGYRATRELFKKYTGVTFDPLGAAEALAHHVLGLILHPERAARLVDYHSRQPDYPGLNEVLTRLIDATWKSPAKRGVPAEIQRVVNTVLLFRTMNLAVHERSPVQVRAIAFTQLVELKEWLAQQVKMIQDPDQKSHFVFALSEISRFQDDPQEFRFVEPLSPPPGAPIGSHSESLHY